MVFNVLVGNLRMCSIPTGKHVRAQGLFSVRVATSWAHIPRRLSPGVPLMASYWMSSVLEWFASWVS